MAYTWKKPSFNPQSTIRSKLNIDECEMWNDDVNEKLDGPKKADEVLDDSLEINSTELASGSRKGKKMSSKKDVLSMIHRNPTCTYD